MKLDTINNIVIWAILFTIIGDSLALIAELLNQKSEEKAERDTKVKEEKLNQELENLRQRITFLEKQLDTVQ